MIEPPYSLAQLLNLVMNVDPGRNGDVFVSQDFANRVNIRAMTAQIGALGVAKFMRGEFGHPRIGLCKLGHFSLELTAPGIRPQRVVSGYEVYAVIPLLKGVNGLQCPF